MNTVSYVIPYALCIGDPQSIIQPSSLNYFQQCTQIGSYQPYNLLPTYPLPYLWQCPFQQQQPDRNITSTQPSIQRMGGSVMVYRLIFRPPFTWTFNCFCDCEEFVVLSTKKKNKKQQKKRILFIYHVFLGQHVNFTEADKYVKGQLREAVSGVT
ncbi:hypothetical protein LOAG_12428 [Loa loa]|uniref:Uncharacterized protein n=1 Tax=Loa loa TaxID=7209 RepID=A0A1S0TMB8_LOALO|nr:hypothetical protein LOAG_12428 [Loa loa]EFO16081.1 hypothetical protein LOAG_12428 [Loa loa]